MSPVITILLVLQATFGVVFGMGFFVPLVTAGLAEREQRQTASGKVPKDDSADFRFSLLDWHLILTDSIPAFRLGRMLRRMIRNAPEDSRAAAVKWRSEPGVRFCFYASMAPLLSLPLYRLV